jgi:outer membrane protein TolC
MNEIKIVALAVLIFNAGFFAQQETLDTLINIALDKSPELKMLQYKMNAAENRIQQNSNLPDPMLTLGVMSLPLPSLAFNKEMMTAKIVGLSQEFPFPGKLSTIEQKNSKDAEVVEQEYYDKQNEIIKSITQSYDELKYIRKEIEITKKSKALMQQIMDVVRSMYLVSEASQQNVFRVDLEITSMDEMLSKLKGEEDEILSNINSLLLRDPSIPINTDSLIISEYIEVSFDQLLDSARVNRPYLKGISLLEEKEQLSESVAGYEYLPMFKISAQYAFRDKVQDMPLDDMISVMLDISIPLNYGGKVSSMVQESKSMQNMYREQFSASLQMLKKEFGSVISKIKSIKSRIKLIEEGSLVQAQENLNSALTAYQVGKIDFMNIIDAQNNLYTLEKNLYRLKTDYNKQVAELRFLTGAKNLNNKD